MTAGAKVPSNPNLLEEDAWRWVGNVSSTGVPRSQHPPPPLGPPQEPRHGPTVGSYGVAVSYKRGSDSDHEQGASQRRAFCLFC